MKAPIGGGVIGVLEGVIEGFNDGGIEFGKGCPGVDQFPVLSVEPEQACGATLEEGAGEVAESSKRMMRCNEHEFQLLGVGLNPRGV